jgi:hypothetical protein
MGEEPKVRAFVDVIGSDYDSLARQARAAAVALLGPDRTYWLDLGDVIPVVRSEGDETFRWEARAVIVYPNTPAF